MNPDELDLEPHWGHEPGSMYGRSMHGGGYKWEKRRSVYHDPYDEACDCDHCLDDLIGSGATPDEIWHEIVERQKERDARAKKPVSKKVTKPKKAKPEPASVPFEVPTTDHKPEFETTLQMKARWTVRGEHVHVILFARLPGQTYANAGQMILRTDEFEIFMQENSHWEFEYREDMFGG